MLCKIGNNKHFASICQFVITGTIVIYLYSAEQYYRADSKTLYRLYLSFKFDEQRQVNVDTQETLIQHLQN